MKAVRIHDYGSTDEMVEERVPRPIPAPGQVLVKIRAAGVNPVDAEIRLGEMQSFWSYDLPLILRGRMSRGGGVSRRKENSWFKSWR